ncbi:MAG: hypothetical protein MR704_20370 [Clostridia bacterium]|nr:hypothetical protein [Clostridia bacterium]
MAKKEQNHRGEGCRRAITMICPGALEPAQPGKSQHQPSPEPRANKK